MTKRPEPPRAEPSRDEIERERHAELLAALDRLTRATSTLLEEIRDELKRQR